jgi:hypothetical protein
MKKLTKNWRSFDIFTIFKTIVIYQNHLFENFEN